MRISDWSSDVCSSDLRRHRQHFAGMNVENDTRAADRFQIGYRIAELAFEHALDARVDRQHKRLSARRLVGELLVERTLDPGDAMPFGIGETEELRREAELRIKPLLLAREVKADIADRVHRRHQI